MVLYSPLVAFTEKMLDVTTARHRVVANNLANINTPGFKRSEVSFEEALERIKGSKDETDLAEEMRTSSAGVDPAIIQNVSMENLYIQGSRYSSDGGVNFSLANAVFDRMFDESPAAGIDVMKQRKEESDGQSRADIIAGVQPIVVTEGGSQRLDGNNVSPEVEVSKMIKNTSFYNVLVSSISGEFRTLKTIISNR